jgi:hypothetical protein
MSYLEYGRQERSIGEGYDVQYNVTRPVARIINLPT